MSVAIRSLQAADVAALQAMDQVAHGEAWSHATFAGQISDPTCNHIVAIAPTKELLGHAATWLDNDTLRVINVATNHLAAGRGVASALLLRLLAEPITAERILLEVRPSNRRAQRLYSRFGFVPAGIERDFYDHADDGDCTDALVMTVSDPLSFAWRERLTRIADQLDQGAAA